jgi:flagellar hook-length control protein FliK
MQMDISLGASVSAAALSPDPSCASAEAPDGASDLFAALLDVAAGASGQPTPDANADDDEDAFDEQAAWMMTSLFFMEAFAPVPEAPAEGDSISGEETGDAAGATGEIVADAIAGARLPVEAAATIGDHIAAAAADSGAATAAAPATNVGGAVAPETMVADAKTVSTPAEKSTAAIDAARMPDAAAATSGIDSPPSEASSRREITGDKQPQAAQPDDVVPVAKAADATQASKVDDPAPVSKPTRASKPSHSEHTKSEQKAVAALAAALAEAHAATAVAPIADAAQASARGITSLDVQTPATTAARFARAVERAAALTGTEASGGAAVASTAPAGQSAGQQPPFGEATPDQTAERFGAVRQAATGGMTFTIAAPTPIDVRAITTAMAGATHAAEGAPGSIPERDVMAQLVQSMRLQFRDGIGEAVLKLRPEHLGSVQISLRIENGAIKATVQAELPAVRLWLESQQETLKNSLADQGLRLERFVVEPDGERQAAQHDAERQRQQRRRQHRREGSADQPVFEVLA